MNPLDYFKSASDMSSQIRVSNILNPLLWMLPALVVGLVVVSFGNNVLIQWFFVIAITAVGSCILIVFLLVLLYGVFKDKEVLTLLRSEDYSVKMKYLETLGDQTHSFREVVDSEPQNNPEFPEPDQADSLPTDKI